MSHNPAIKLTNVSKKFKLYARPLDRLKESLNPFSRDACTREHWALRDISIEVQKGETLGILGRNGAGKSTLLQIVTSVLSPSSGVIEVRGKISALLELGIGFAPDMTGRENVLAQALLLGLARRDMQERLPAIEAFADIGGYIDQPVKTYSSGMFVRLAFAVAMSVDPDIVIIDEALAVGDAAFQEKCFRRLRGLKEQGKTFLLVSHSAAMISQLCDRVVLLEGGAIDFIGSPREGLSRYGELMFGSHMSDKTVASVAGSLALSSEIPPADSVVADDNVWAGTDEGDVLYNCPGYNPGERRSGRGGVILDCRIYSNRAPASGYIDAGAEVDILIKCRFDEVIASPRLSITLHTPEGTSIYDISNRMLSFDIGPVGVGEIKTFRLSFYNRLSPQPYLLGLWLMSEEIGAPRRVDIRESVITLECTGNVSFNGMVDLGATLAAFA